MNTIIAFILLALGGACAIIGTLLLRLYRDTRDADQDKGD